jgi:hypothetical protein
MPKTISTCVRMAASSELRLRENSEWQTLAPTGKRPRAQEKFHALTNHSVSPQTRQSLRSPWNQKAIPKPVAESTETCQKCQLFHGKRNTGGCSKQVCS